MSCYPRIVTENQHHRLVQVSDGAYQLEERKLDGLGGVHWSSMGSGLYPAEYSEQFQAFVGLIVRGYRAQWINETGTISRSRGALLVLAGTLLGLCVTNLVNAYLAAS